MPKKIVQIDGEELACIIAEKAIGVLRPKGMTARNALQYFEPDARQGFINAAAAATEYILKQLEDAKGIQ